MAKKSSPKKKIAIINALNKTKMNAYFDGLSPEDVSRLRDHLRNELGLWIGDPTIARLGALKDEYPFLSSTVHFKIINKRLGNLDQFDRHPLGVHITEFMPELKEILNECEKRFGKIRKGVEKARLWLLPIAEDAAADANVEAAVYFASRGVKTIDPNVLKRKWHETICESIVRGRPLASRLTEDIKQRAKQKLISLSEAAALLNFLDTMPRFFYFRNEEEDFIDATFLRGVEWFDIRGFEPWVNSFADEFSSLTLTEHIPGSWFIFFLCRSDLAMNNIKKIGLESLLWWLTNGPIERSKPWKQTYWNDKNPRTIDYLPVASAIIFGWQRIDPKNLEQRVLNDAIDLLFGTQLATGAWPIWGHEPEGSILSTCFAIHALAMAKPKGWKQVCKSGKDWLLKQQDDSGCWYIQGGPTVMLTVLALDSIDLAEDKNKVTFGRNSAEMALVEVEEIDPVYDYSDVQWHNPDYPELISVSKKDAVKRIKPQVAIIVATEIELKQALFRLKPIRGKKITKVPFGVESYYLGKFGQFQTVIVRSTMGSEGPAGSTLTVDSLLRTWKPKVAVLAGIAFGANKIKHRPGDVLIAEAIAPYENQRVGDDIVFRNTVPPSSPTLLNRFQNALVGSLSVQINQWYLFTLVQFYPVQSW